ncbi:asc-type amino acid transporter 1 [Aplysia californica]|uniref:Asc-type amino acid transporter 1 n=1 Tax=Aplysia californica TaxID=6500 RepID=A0ABM0ZXW3_APLCA|nr:asc-type amino acid transporter 1 [Aplysia californica]
MRPFVQVINTGSGIFVSPKGVMLATGSVGLCMFVWVFGGVITMFNALCFSELGTLIPKAGGTYTYLRLGLGNVVAFIMNIQTWADRVLGKAAVIIPLAVIVSTFGTTSNVILGASR